MKAHDEGARGKVGEVARDPQPGADDAVAGREVGEARDRLTIARERNLAQLLADGRDRRVRDLPHGREVSRAEAERDTLRGPRLPARRRRERDGRGQEQGYRTSAPTSRCSLAFYYRHACSNLGSPIRGGAGRRQGRFRSRSAEGQAIRRLRLRRRALSPGAHQVGLRYAPRSFRLEKLKALGYVK